MAICLIVEDNPINIVMMQNQMQKLGYDTDICENGKEALDYCKSNDMPSVILLDGYMPKMDGLEFLELFLKLPNSKEAFVIFCSSSMDKNDVDKALEIGANCHIPKPLDEDELKKSLKAVK